MVPREAHKRRSEEYVFVYDISEQQPRKTQVLKVPDTFAGIAFFADGSSF